MRKLPTVGLIVLALGLSACDREATGQVVAVVNGEEVTLQELNAELGELNIPDGVDKKPIQQAGLKRIVDRRLLAQAARKEELDKDPEFLIRKRQLEDTLLAQMLSRKMDRATAVPADTAIDSFIRANPSMFGNRAIYTVDRIQFMMPPDPSQLEALRSAHSMDEIGVALKRMGVPFQRGQGQMDSALLGAEQLKQILALPDGEPFVVPEGNIVTAAVITGREPAPLADPDARPIAVQAMRNESLTKALNQRLDSEKAQAQIEYQSGFAPTSGQGEAIADLAVKD